MLRQAKRVTTIGTHAVLKRRDRSVQRVDERRLDEALDRYADFETVFVHVGLSDVRQAFDRNPYAFLLEKLRSNFDSILAPGFTDYFRTSGVYHKQFSLPKHGTFSRLFLDDADYRTDDAIKSILVDGPYRFDDCDHHRSYDDDGCFAKLDRENVLVMNIGTPWLKCSHLHYIEQFYDVPYIEETDATGTIYYDEDSYDRITQRTPNYTSKFYSFNKRKIMSQLDREGVLDYTEMNGLNVYFFSVRDLRRALEPELLDDPYYLVT